MEKQEKVKKKGRTWGPSSIYQKEKEKRERKNRSRLYSEGGQGRSSSFPNLGSVVNRPAESASGPQTPKELSKFTMNCQECYKCDRLSLVRKIDDKFSKLKIWMISKIAVHNITSIT